MDSGFDEPTGGQACKLDAYGAVQSHAATAWLKRQLVLAALTSRRPIWMMFGTQPVAVPAVSLATRIEVMTPLITVVGETQQEAKASARGGSATWVPFK